MRTLERRGRRFSSIRLDLEVQCRTPDIIFNFSIPQQSWILRFLAFQRPHPSFPALKVGYIVLSRTSVRLPTLCNTSYSHPPGHPRHVPRSPPARQLIEFPQFARHSRFLTLHQTPKRHLYNITG